MSIRESMLQTELADLRQRVHTFVSTVGNALERIEIYIDEDDPDEAKRELAELLESLGKVSGP